MLKRLKQFFMSLVSYPVSETVTFPELMVNYSAGMEYDLRFTINLLVNDLLNFREVKLGDYTIRLRKDLTFIYEPVSTSNECFMDVISLETSIDKIISYCIALEQEILKKRAEDLNYQILQTKARAYMHLKGI